MVRTRLPRRSTPTVPSPFGSRTQSTSGPGSTTEVSESGSAATVDAPSIDLVWRGGWRVQRKLEPTHAPAAANATKHRPSLLFMRFRDSKTLPCSLESRHRPYVPWTETTPPAVLGDRFD